MPQFWFDTDSFVNPSRGPYRFGTVPTFWEWLEQKGKEKVIASPEFVLVRELTGNDPQKADDLEVWAKKQQGTLFWSPTEEVQQVYKQVAQSVINEPRYAGQYIAEFLDGADPWVISYAKALGGRVVTFEKSEPLSTKPKIPDVADKFNVKCIILWDVLTELKAKF
jgi:hypothetical protein